MDTRTRALFLQESGPLSGPSGTDLTGNVAGSRGFGLPETPSLLVHDPGGPAQIRHASTVFHDIFGEPDVKGGNIGVRR